MHRFLCDLEHLLGTKDIRRMRFLPKIHVFFRVKKDGGDEIDGPYVDRDFGETELEAKKEVRDRLFCTFWCDLYTGAVVLSVVLDIFSSHFSNERKLTRRYVFRARTHKNWGSEGCPKSCCLYV